MGQRFSAFIPQRWVDRYRHIIYIKNKKIWKNHEKSWKFGKNHEKLGKIMKNWEKSWEIGKNHEKSRKIKWITKIRKHHENWEKSWKIMKNQEKSRKVKKNHEKSSESRSDHLTGRISSNTGHWYKSLFYLFFSEIDMKLLLLLLFSYNGTWLGYVGDGAPLGDGPWLIECYLCHSLKCYLSLWAKFYLWKYFHIFFFWNRYEAIATIVVAIATIVV